MSPKAVFFLVNGIVMAIVIYLCASNSQSVPVCFGVAQTSLPAGMLILTFWALGAVVCALAGVPLVSGMQETNVAKLKKWQEQDAKLAIELQSDREKQLEKKIETLEAALKQALKR